MLKTKNKHLRYVITFFAVLCSSLLQTFVIESFVHSAGLLSGGFYRRCYFDRPGGIALRRVHLHLSRTGGAESAGGGPLLPQHQPEIHAFFPSASRHDQLIPEILLSAADF